MVGTKNNKVYHGGLSKVKTAGCSPGNMTPLARTPPPFVALTSISHTEEQPFNE